MNIEITIPVLNEEATLRQNVEKVLSFLATQPAPLRDAKLVIADNGSTDQTRTIAESLQSTSPNIRYIRLDQRGVGLALKTSWSRSTADIVGYFDLDLATDLNHMTEVLQAFQQGADIVYGTRLHKRSRVIGRTLKREITSRAFNTILKVYLGAKFSDGMCGFKFLRREILPGLRENGAVSDGWFFSTELLYVGQKMGYSLYELPVVWTDDPDSRVNISRLSAQYLKAMQVLKRACP